MRNIISVALTAALCASSVLAYVPMKMTTKADISGMRWQKEAGKLLDKAGTPAAKSRAVRIDAQNLIAFMDANTAHTSDYAIVDLREESAYTAGHVRGAIKWPIKDSTAEIEEHQKQIADGTASIMDLKDKLGVIFYCQQGTNRSPAIAAAWAKKMGKKGKQQVALLQTGMTGFADYDKTHLYIVIGDQLDHKSVSTVHTTTSSTKAPLSPKTPTSPKSKKPTTDEEVNTHAPSSGSSHSSSSTSSHLSGSSGSSISSESTSSKSTTTKPKSTSAKSTTSKSNSSKGTSGSSTSDDQDTALVKRKVAIKFRA